MAKKQRTPRKLSWKEALVVIALAMLAGLARQMLAPSYDLSNIPDYDGTSAYAIIANGGVRVDPTPVLTITNSKGEVIVDNTTPDASLSKTHSEQVISPEVAHAAVEVMKTVVNSSDGTGTEAALPNGQVVAAKTGTSTEYKDITFCGITPQMAVAVWLGDPANVKTLPASRPSSSRRRPIPRTRTSPIRPTMWEGPLARRTPTTRRMTRRRRTPRTRTPTRARTILRRRRRRRLLPRRRPRPRPIRLLLQPPIRRRSRIPIRRPLPRRRPTPEARRTSRQARLRTRKPFRYERVASPARRRANRYDSSTMIRCKRAGKT